MLIKDPELIKSITIKDFDHFTDHKEFFTTDSDPLFAGSLLMMKGKFLEEGLYNNFLTLFIPILLRFTSKIEFFKKKELYTGQCIMRWLLYVNVMQILFLNCIYRLFLLARLYKLFYNKHLSVKLQLPLQKGHQIKKKMKIHNFKSQLFSEQNLY